MPFSGSVFHSAASVQFRDSFLVVGGDNGVGYKVRW